MFKPIKVKIDNNIFGWCVFDMNNSCVLCDCGVYQTLTECKEYIREYLESLNEL